MNDLQKGLVHRNLCYAAMKKIKSFCGTKHPTKGQVKKNEMQKEKCKSESMMIKVCMLVKILLIN